MSDQRLRDLERQYAEDGDDRSLRELLSELQRLGPTPCPNCERKIQSAQSGRVTCSWCGTIWNPDAARDHLDRLETIAENIRMSLEFGASAGLNTAGTVTGRLSSSRGPNVSALPRSRPVHFVGEGIDVVRRDPSTRLIAGEGISFHDRDGDVVISRVDPTEPAVALCSIFTCAEPTWRSVLDDVCTAGLCLGHAIEFSDREGIEVPASLREALAETRREEIPFPNTTYVDSMTRISCDWAADAETDSPTADAPGSPASNPGSNEDDGASDSDE